MIISKDLTKINDSPLYQWSRKNEFPPHWNALSSGGSTTSSKSIITWRNWPRGMKNHPVTVSGMLVLQPWGWCYQELVGQEWVSSCQASYGTLWLQEDMAQLKCRKVVEVLLKKETLVPQINIDRDLGADPALRSGTKFCILRQNVKKHDTFKHLESPCPCAEGWITIHVITTLIKNLKEAVKEIPCHHSCLAPQEKTSLNQGNCSGLTWRGCAGWRRGETLQPSLPAWLWGCWLLNISVQDSRQRTFTPSPCFMATPSVGAETWPLFL